MARLQILDWLATPWGTRPALPEFPANREYYREFSKIMAFRHLRDPSFVAKQGFFSQVPYSEKQGINSVNSEVWLWNRDSQRLSQRLTGQTLA
jgi:hypothetical protein